MELVELMKPHDEAELQDEELHGRQTGSLAWRRARGELGDVEDAKKIEKYVWTLSDDEKEAGVFQLEYNVSKDLYIRGVARKKVQLIFCL